jgi:hypothetical protein
MASAPWSKSIPTGVEFSRHDESGTGSSGLFAIHVVEMLIDEDGEAHEYAFPWRHGFSELIVTPEHEDPV